MSPSHYKTYTLTSISGHSFPGEKKAASAYGPAAAAAPAAAEDDEDDIDLFGSDDEEVDEEAERIKQQRLAEYHAKKSASECLCSHLPFALGNGARAALRMMIPAFGCTVPACFKRCVLDDENIRAT